jgi:N6-adenosine-specific RNA methylase IME4
MLVGALHPHALMCDDSAIFDVAYIDAPWGYQIQSNKGTLRNKDKTWKFAPLGWSALRRLVLPLRRDAVVFVWCTSPLLPSQLSVMENWGLSGIRLFRAFMKESRIQRLPYFGTGYYTAANCEWLLVGFRGTATLDAIPEVQRAVIEAHSVKPASFRDAVCRTTPGSSRIEMFARTTDPRFAAHGDQQNLLTTASGATEQALRVSATGCVVADFRTRTRCAHTRVRTTTKRKRTMVDDGGFRAIVLDLGLDRLQQVVLDDSLQDTHCFVLARLDPLDLGASTRCFKKWGMIYKTIMFVVVDSDDATFVQLWGVGVNVTTRITADGIKRRHISSVLDRRCDSLLLAVETVLGTDVRKLLVQENASSTSRSGWVARDWTSVASPAWKGDTSAARVAPLPPATHR